VNQRQFALAKDLTRVATLAFGQFSTFGVRERMRPRAFLSSVHPGTSVATVFSRRHAINGEAM